MTAPRTPFSAVACPVEGAVVPGGRRDAYPPDPPDARRAARRGRRHRHRGGFARGAAAPSGGRPPEVRVATFNASLNRNAEGQLIEHLSTPGNAQAATVAEIIQRVRPDLLLINEFDFDEDGTAAELFQHNYLAVPHNGAAAIEYPYRFVAPSNTGMPSGLTSTTMARSAGRTTPSASGPSPASSAWPSTRCTPSCSTHPHLPDVPVGRHAEGPVADDRPPPNRPTGYGRRAGRRAPVVEEALGPADRHRRAPRALPRQPPDAAGV